MPEHDQPIDLEQTLERSFHIGDILSITTGRLVSPRHIGGIYDILNYMTGDNLMTAQLPRAAKQCKPLLLERYPQLEEVDTSGLNEDSFQTWLTQQVLKFGEELPVPSITLRNRVILEPLSEISEKIGHDRVIIVNRSAPQAKR